MAGARVPSFILSAGSEKKNERMPAGIGTIQNVDEHISDHDLERYYLGMVPKASAEEGGIEAHLLWCHECIERAEASDIYVDAIRAAIIQVDYDLETR